MPILPPMNCIASALLALALEDVAALPTDRPLVAPSRWRSALSFSGPLERISQIAPCDLKKTGSESQSWVHLRFGYGDLGGRPCDNQRREYRDEGKRLVDEDVMPSLGNLEADRSRRCQFYCLAEPFRPD